MTRKYSQKDSAKDHGKKVGADCQDDRNKEVRSRIVRNIYPEGIYNTITHLKSHGYFLKNVKKLKTYYT